MTKKNNQNKDILIHMLSAINDVAIRAYYVYYLVTKLVRDQEKSIWEKIALPLSIASSIVTILIFIQNPKSWLIIAIIYGAIMLVLILGLVFDKLRGKGKEVLKDEIYLGIYLDQVLKSMKELKLILELGEPQNTSHKDFAISTIQILQSSLSFLTKKINRLRNKGRYPKCLELLGRSDVFVESTFKQAEVLIEETISYFKLKNRNKRKKQEK